MEQKSAIFRKAALDKLSSPEQLDQLMQVTTPKSWLALGACCALIVTALVWGIFGSIPTNIYGRGILIKQGGVFVASSRGDGNVLQIFATPGDLVTNGQVLALVSQPELELRIKQAEISQKRLLEEFRLLDEFQLKENKEHEADAAQQRLAYQAMIADFGQQIKALEDRLQTQEQLLTNRGVFSKVQLLETRNQLFQAQHELARANIQLKQINVNEMQANERRRKEREDKQHLIQQGEHQLEYLRELHELNTRIKSPYQGNVLEIMVKEGQLITPNTPILSLQGADKKLEGRFFLSPAEGKLVQKEMRAAISPVSIKKEEYGYLIGKVRSVAEFPSTPQGMLRVLENPALAAEFSQGGAPIEVTVDLETAGDTPSGYRWSSLKGPPSRLTSGTLCQGTITITNQRPISLVLPLVKKGIGF